MLTRTQALEGGANVTCISIVQFTYHSFIQLTILGHYATDKQFELKCPNWKFWAYTDGSCIGKAENFINAGAYCPQTKAECYVNSGGVGMASTINRAELTEIVSALTNKYTKIATDSACSLSQIRKQLLFPEMQRDHIHSNLLEQTVSIIYASP